MWVTKLLIFPVKIRIFCQRTTKFGPKLALLFILGQALPAHLVSSWWVSRWLWRAFLFFQYFNFIYAPIVIPQLDFRNMKLICDCGHFFLSEFHDCLKLQVMFKMKCGVGAVSNNANRVFRREGAYDRFGDDSLSPQ